MAIIFDDVYVDECELFRNNINYCYCNIMMQYNKLYILQIM